MKLGDLVIPSSYSNYREIFPPKMIVKVVQSERAGKATTLYVLEGEDLPRREETLILVSEA